MFILNKHSESPKNKLQEFCQKLQLELPRYQYTTLPTGPNGESAFMCNVKITYQNIAHSEEGIASNKKLASKKAVLNLIRKLKTAIKPTEVYIKNNGYPNVCILIDLENVNCDFFQTYKLITNENAILELYGFCHKNHPSLKQEHLPYMIYETTNSSRRDAADIKMILTAGELYSMSSDSIIYIITGDHFGDVVTEVLTEDDNENKRIFSCNCLEDLL